MIEGRRYPKAVKAQERKDKNWHAHRRLRLKLNARLKVK